MLSPPIPQPTDTDETKSLIRRSPSLTSGEKEKKKGRPRRGYSLRRMFSKSRTPSCQAGSDGASINSSSSEDPCIGGRSLSPPERPNNTCELFLDDSMERKLSKSASAHSLGRRASETYDGLLTLPTVLEEHTLALHRRDDSSRSVVHIVVGEGEEGEEEEKCGPISRLKRSLSARLKQRESTSERDEPLRVFKERRRSLGRSHSFMSALRGGRRRRTEEQTISSEGVVEEKLRSVSGSLSSGSHSHNSQREDELTPRTLSKKKYFSENNRKSVFKKLLNPTFHQRSEQFKKLFRGRIDDDEQLLASYSCAYQREILAQGRIFISNHHLCFHANIFSWETLLVVNLDNVKSMTKQRAAKIFPNSIQIETCSGDKYFFASFVNREKSFTVLNTAWNRVKEGNPISAEELWEMMNPEDEEKEVIDAKSVTKSSVSVKRTPNSSAKKSIDMHKHRSVPALTGASSSRNSDSGSAPDRPEVELCGGEPGAETVSRASEDEEATCPHHKHNGKLLVDSVYPMSVEQAFQILFSDSPWFQRFNETLRNSEHCKLAENVSGYVASPWALDKHGIRQRTCTYTMALNHAMAPKSCVVTEKQSCTDLPRHGDGFVVDKETHNAGVPYADSFVVQCTYCVTRVNATCCRLRVHGGIVYKKSIWSVIKSYIEKSTYQGLHDHYAALEATLNEEVGRGTTRHDMEPEEAGDAAAEEEEEEKGVTVEEEQVVGRLSVAERRVDRVAAAPAQAVDARLAYAGIALLSALVFLHLLLLIRVCSIDTRPPSIIEQLMAVGKSSASSQETLDSLASALQSMQDNLNRLKREL